VNWKEVMPSPPALRHGAYYHIFNRGTNRENIFIEERNYSYFLKLYVKHIEPVADTFAYCLLKNHFHLLIRTKTILDQQTFRDLKSLNALKSKSPSQSFSNLFNAYAKAINKAYDRTGSLFEHPFERVEVNSQAHLFNLVSYIHFNPQKHGFVSDIRDWPYSSFHGLNACEKTWLQRDEVFGWFGSRNQFEKYHHDYGDFLEFEHLVLDDEE
jgi:putative transposase